MKTLVELRLGLGGRARVGRGRLRHHEAISAGIGRLADEGRDIGEVDRGKLTRRIRSTRQSGFSGLQARDHRHCPRGRGWNVVRPILRVTDGYISTVHEKDVAIGEKQRIKHFEPRLTVERTIAHQHLGIRDVAAGELHLHPPLLRGV